MLVQVAPIVLAGQRFALKGGTAINLFERDMPRLSVDLDLVLQDGSLGRANALSDIAGGLTAAKDSLERRGYRVVARSTAGSDDTTLHVSREDVAVKVEVNHVMRGTVRPIRMATLVPSAQAALKATASLPVLDVDELYGSKLVAAMDRQHPRDLFDVAQMQAHGGLTTGMVECFVAYLACHNRPLHEVLFPPEKNIASLYREQFVGMTTDEVALEYLVEVRAQLMRDLPSRLTPGQRAFLRSLARAEPDYLRLGIDHLGDLPAMRWKLENLRRLREKDRRKFELQAEMLDERLGATA